MRCAAIRKVGDDEVVLEGITITGRLICRDLDQPHST